MKRTVLLMVSIFVLANCVSTGAFDTLRQKVNEMDRIQKMNAAILAEVAKANKSNDDNILELARNANFLFKQLEDVRNQLIIAQAGAMQNNKDLADFDEKAKKLEKKAIQLAKRIADWEIEVSVNSGNINILREELMFLHNAYLRHLENKH